MLIGRGLQSIQQWNFVSTLDSTRMSSDSPPERHPKPPMTPKQRRNRITGAICGFVFVGMVGASFAAVPFYRAFCEATGYDGTVRRATATPDRVLTKTVTIRFDTNVDGLPWDFVAEQPPQVIKLGETKLAMFKVTNHSNRAITGRAVFNVVPEQTALYFEKLSCFCFSDQTIQAGKTVELPVLYFVDPKYAQDIDTKNKPEITLSYTFYPAADVKPAATRASRS
jgi:cytochrome c oxidase assembly protein subunit 11